jgi:hypothetical protein
MPGGGPMPGGPQMPGGAGLGGGKEPVLEPKRSVFPDSNLNRDFDFILECRRTDDPQNPWQVSRTWRGAPAELRFKDVNLLPLYSVQ